MKKRSDCCKVMAVRVASRRKNKYYYRYSAKKRKCTISSHHNNSSNSLNLPPPKRKCPISQMPANVLEKIFSFVDYDELGVFFMPELVLKVLNSTF